MHSQKYGVILLNMGGPTCLDDVRPFLYNIFSDREIIILGPPFLQKPIAWYIAKKRAPKSMKIYETIGGKSPITEITRQQQIALMDSLRANGNFTVVTAMRYWHPTTAQALRELEQINAEKIFALSLYPHYSCATSGSSLNELKRQLLEKSDLEVVEISSWPDHPGYISCLSERILKGLKLFNEESVELLYSAHSLPVSFINEGDPYVDHLNRTISEVEKLTGKKGTLCYQSRSGPVEWLSPSTPETIIDCASKGVKNILMVPISFVSDHVETLYEINIQYRDLAADHGIRLEPTESLNTDPEFIAVLKDLVLSSV